MSRRNNSRIVGWLSMALSVSAFQTYHTHFVSPPDVRRGNFQLASSSSSMENEKKKAINTLSSVEFVDPKTKCHVVLVGCFHGTESSAKDVESAVTPDTNVVALELCHSRFTDLKQELQRNQEQYQQDQKPWLSAYAEMVSKTTRKRGLPTGLAAAVLGGFSGIQTALSGFTPGLEFIRALEWSEKFNCEIVLADQEVDETLRRVGSLPQISLENALDNNRFQHWSLTQDTLVRAVAGKGEDDIPQMKLPMVLLRNPSAIIDLIRLTVPPTIAFWTILFGVASIFGIDTSRAALEAQSQDLTILENIQHWSTSTGILSLGYFGLALPAVGVILTERDVILTKGIQAACQRAGEGGRVVAVLGMLHVNGIAKRMLDCDEDTIM